MISESEPPIQLKYHYFFERGREFAYGVGQFPYWALLAPEAGTFHYALGTERGSVGFGDLLFCPPHSALRRRINDVMTYHILTFTAEPSAANTLPVGVVSLRDSVRLSSTFHHLRHWAERETAFSVTARSHLLLDMLYLVQAEREKDTHKRSDPTHADHTTLFAKQLIESQAFSDLSLRQVAQEARLTPVQLTRRFRESFGQTPVAYLTSFRLAKARALLMESDLAMREVAHQCGFSSEHYFSRVFFQATGVRPGEFRKTRRV